MFSTFVVAANLMFSFSASGAGVQRPKVDVDGATPALHTAGGFERALTQRVTVDWSIPLREAVRTIIKTQKVAVLLDRRIDPTQKLKLKLEKKTLLQVIDAVANAVGARTAVVGNVVYVGPPRSVAALSAALKARAVELRGLFRRLPAARRRALVGRRTLHWHDLDAPRDLLKRHAGDYGVTVDNLQRIPHDLWAGGTLPAMSITQSLSLVLTQFDLTFGWKKDARGIEIVPAAVPKE